MNRYSAEQILQKNLQANEKVCWRGRSEEFPLMEKDAKVQILGKWIGTCIAAAAISLLCIYSDKSTTVIAIILLAGAVLLAAPVFERRGILNQSYFITNQRAILVTGNQDVFSVDLRNIDAVQTVYGKTQYGCLVLGSRLFPDIDCQLRWRACNPQEDVLHTDSVDGMVFFNIRDCATARRLLQQREEKLGA